ncbi:NUDIX hydrolase [Amycolatopsis alba]|uniref:NUDIX domain-containing protein n=1 Tax=Amycolatopsis alba DSM 44262 TaxID=1125972 RepID=A0A229RDQ3_AMYAL|nr:NUDIX domain-containing protein [Amycolatopsis alba]OXM44802.1 NUDIX domain-containing protein [Amycolatopsis alba DSM 44262]
MPHYPVSIKGVVVRSGRVLLLHNERGEWELPGGRIELGESPEECVAREIYEETRIGVDVVDVLDSWMYHIEVADKDVFIVTYGCRATTDAAPVVSHEHKRVGEFTADEVPDLVMPAGYKASIAKWFALLGADNAAG